MQDADSFYNSKKAVLEKAKLLMQDKDPSLVCVIPAEVLGQKWHEGIGFLELVIRTLLLDHNITLTTCNQLIADQFKLDRIEPYPCAKNGLGYGEDLLDSSNSWSFRYLRKASERMVELAERFTGESGLKARLLNIGGKELLLAQSSGYLQMIHDSHLPEWTRERLTGHILNFTTVFDSLASNSISTEWLTNLEEEDCIFPWLNYRIFSKKIQ